ncbi:hypothetical protein D7W18_10150 [Escherichia coli]|nr:hypothetical protein [Escherichia coli]
MTLVSHKVEAYKGLSGMRGNSHVPFLGGGETVMNRCYPTGLTCRFCRSDKAFTPHPTRYSAR